MLDTIVTFQDGADLVWTYTFRPYAFLDSFRLEHTGSPQTNGTGHPTPDLEASPSLTQLLDYLCNGFLRLIYYIAKH